LLTGSEDLLFCLPACASEDPYGSVRIRTDPKDFLFFVSASLRQRAPASEDLLFFFSSQRKKD
jgi:hypothetical protein